MTTDAEGRGVPGAAMTTKPKRYEYHITYDRKAKMWVCKVGGGVFRYCYERTNIVSLCAFVLTEYLKYFGQHSELIIHKKDGTIGRGSSSRRTYGDDPKSRG